MQTQSPDNLAAFHRFVGEQVEKGRVTALPEEILDEWRVLHPEPPLTDDDMDAIQEALDDIENGDVGIPFEDFDREICARYGFPAKS